MTSVRHVMRAGAAGLALLMVVTAAAGQGGESFSATASVKSAAGAAATAPVTVTITRKTPASEATAAVAAFKQGGADGLRKALAAMPSAGTVEVGKSSATARLAIERTTDKGRLLTIVTDKPLLFVGASLPNAKPTAGHDFAVVDIEVDASGSGAGTLAPAAKVGVKQGAFVVEDYGAEMVRLTAVKMRK